jgi:3-oxoacyl-[acyl-carrier protein] reductase
MDLHDKTALITGGGTGVGKAVSLMLAKLGASAAINYSQSKAEAEATTSEAKKLGVRAIAVQADVADDAQVHRMVDRVKQELGAIDILVNNAAFTRFTNHADLYSLCQQDWNRTFSVNVNGTFYCSRAVAPIMKARGWGRIVNISSIAAFSGRGSSIAYAASKAAILSITRSLSNVLGPEITVNAIAPGLIETRWVADHPDLEHMRESWVKQTALGRVLLPQDIAEVAISLITSMNLVTGQTIVVDAGRTV